MRFRSAIPLALPLVLMVGCKPSTPPPAGSAAPRIVASGPPVTEAEATEFGRLVEKAFADKDAAALSTALRIEDIFARSISDFNLTADETKLAMKGFGKNGGGVQLCQSLLSQMGDGVVTLLCTRVKDGRMTAVFRVYGEQNGLNYMEFQIARGLDGRPTTEDLYILQAGESATQILRRMLVATLPSKKGGGGQLQLYQDNMPTIRRMNEQAAAGEFAEAKRLYRSLPTALRDQKNIHILGLRALQGDDPAYLAELERYRQRYPNDPSLDLIMIDYHILKKDAKGLRECMTRLDVAVGGDPMVRVLEAIYLLDQGQDAEAKRLATEALKADDTLATAYWVLVTAVVNAADHAETLRQLQEVAEMGGVTLAPEQMKDDEFYKKFVASPQYKELCEWVAKRKK